MLKYLAGKQFLEDIPPGAKVLIDINAQGIMELDRAGVKFKEKFPNTMALLKLAFMEGTMVPGDVISFKENDIKLIMFVTRYARVGAMKDEDESVKLSTVKCFNKIERVADLNDTIVTSVINRDLKESRKESANLMRELPYNFLIYP